MTVLYRAGQSKQVTHHTEHLGKNLEQHRQGDLTGLPGLLSASGYGDQTSRLPVQKLPRTIFHLIGIVQTLSSPYLAIRPL